MNTRQSQTNRSTDRMQSHHFPPHDRAIERGYLGALMVYGTRQLGLVRRARPDHFYDPGHRTLFGAIVELLEAGTEPDIPIVAHHLGPWLDEVGGRESLIDIQAASAGSVAQASRYLTTLDELARARERQSLAMEVLDATYESDSARVAMLAGRLADAATRPTSVDDPWSSFGEGDVRWADLPPRSHVIDGMLPVGLTILVAAPKMRKSFLAQQVEHHLATGTPFLDRDSAGDAVRCGVIDYEGDEYQVRERSHVLSDLFDDFDHDRDAFNRIWYWKGDSEVSGHTFDERYAWLRHQLDQARQDGNPFGYIRIDTLRRFIGPKPKGVDAYTADYGTVSKLNNLAKEYGIAILAVHHTNNAGGANGSHGALIGGSEASWWLDPAPDDQEVDPGRVFGTFRGNGRNIREFRLGCEFNDGWEINEVITAAEVSHTGLARVILRALNEHGPASIKRMKSYTALLGVKADVIRGTLARLYTKGEVDKRTEGGKRVWFIVDTGPEPPPRPEVESMWDGYECPVAQPCDTPEAPDEPGVTQVTPAETKAMDALRASLNKSTKRPLRRVLPDDRGSPWRELDARAGVRGHRWVDTSVVEDGREVVILDRRGSFPSSMSSVVVGAGKLEPHGALSGPIQGKAGVYLVDVPSWIDTFAPPLGRRQNAVGRVWITDPHLRLLGKLGYDVEILDSYLSNRATTLFRPFSEWCRKVRREAIGTDAYDRVKSDINVTIQMLHTASPSGFWRPDWLQAIHAEAWVRHWVKANAANEVHGNVVGLLNEDEVHVLVEPGEAPDGFEIGNDFGKMSIKGRMSVSQWLESDSVRRAR